MFVGCDIFEYVGSHLHALRAHYAHTHTHTHTHVQYTNTPFEAQRERARERESGREGGEMREEEEVGLR